MIQNPDDLKAQLRDIIVRKRSSLPHHDEETVLENALDTIEWLQRRRSTPMADRKAYVSFTRGCLRCGLITTRPRRRSRRIPTDG